MPSDSTDARRDNPFDWAAGSGQLRQPALRGASLLPALIAAFLLLLILLLGLLGRLVLIALGLCLLRLGLAFLVALLDVLERRFRGLLLVMLALGRALRRLAVALALALELRLAHPNACLLYTSPSPRD